MRLNQNNTLIITKLHGTYVLQIIFAVSSEFVVWERMSKLRFPRTTVRKRKSKAQKRDFAYTLIAGRWHAQVLLLLFLSRTQ